MSDNRTLTPTDSDKGEIRASLPSWANNNPLLIKFIELLADASLTLAEVDEQMGWAVGESKRKLLQYPIIARTAAEARIICLKKVGLNRVSAYEALRDALGALKQECVGEGQYQEVADHKVRIDAAKELIKLMGDAVLPAASAVSVSVQVNNLTVAEKELLEAYKRG